MALRGIKVLELAGLAPSPFAGLILSDFGADVIRIDRLRRSLAEQDFLSRGKRSICLNIKDPDGKEIFFRMVKNADVLIDPFRPGVLERLGLGPDLLLKLNPRLIIGRVTGYGQKGPYSQMAGHDINYIATSGSLSLFGPPDKPHVFPVNILGDFAGGGMLCAMGILLALVERQKSGLGQVIDAAMVDGAAYLAIFVHYFGSRGLWGKGRGKNLLDGGAPFYRTYKTKDDKWMSVGAIEPRFFKELLKGLNITSPISQMNQSKWPALMIQFENVFASRTREEWCQIFDGTDACVAPVLDFTEAKDHPHNQARSLMLPMADGRGYAPAPAPRLSRTPGIVQPRALAKDGENTREVLKELGFTTTEIQHFEKKKVVKAAKSKSKL